MDNLLKIVNYLGKNLRDSFTMNELSKATKIPYATFYRTVFKNKNLFKIISVGQAKVMSLNLNNIIKSFLIISSDKEKNEFLKKHPIINKIVLELKTNECVVLFGSYAKGSENKNSDIDMMIINKQGEKTISFSKYEILFDKKINPIFVTKKEFVEMLNQSEENVGKQVLKGHIILNNPEFFWECVLSGRM